MHSPRCVIPTLLLLLLSLLSCSSDSVYPYTIIKNDTYSTRLYTLPTGVKLYITRTADRPRISASLYMPCVAVDALDTLYAPSVYSSEYPLLFARIGTDVSNLFDYRGSAIVSNDIPSNELENWAVIMQGSFTAFPDSLSIILFGDVVYDDAVATLSHVFSDSSSLSISSDGCHDDAISLLKHIRSQLAENIPVDDALKTVASSDIRPEAKNVIKLLPSPPAKVIFSDIDKLKIKSTSGQPRMVVAENGDALYTFLVRTHFKELPASFLQLIKEYFHTSFDEINDSVASVAKVDIDKNDRALYFTISGCERDMSQRLTRSFSILKKLADGDKFYEYLQKNDNAIESSKKSKENIALQVAPYITADKRISGLREIAKYSMDALFTQSSELLFCGKDASNAYSLYIDILSPAISPTLCNVSSAGDTMARYMLLPLDADSMTTVTYATPYESVEDIAMIKLFNKVAALSKTVQKALFYPEGTLLVSGNNAPVSREEFEAAKSFLLYDISTQGSDGVSLIKEHISYIKYGYTSSQLYDALVRISFADIKEFYKRHNENCVTQLIIGRESDFDIRKFVKRGIVVHLTSDELFGY